jgi:hypothetical protein
MKKDLMAILKGMAVGFVLLAVAGALAPVMVYGFLAWVDWVRSVMGH